MTTSPLTPGARVRIVSADAFNGETGVILGWNMFDVDVRLDDARFMRDVKAVTFTRDEIKLEEANG